VPQQIITIYCFFDQLLKALGHKDDPQAKRTTAQSMTIATVAAQFSSANQQNAPDFLTSHGYLRPFSKSRFNHRLHALPEALWQLALSVLAQIHQHSNPERLPIVDSFPDLRETARQHTERNIGVTHVVVPFFDASRIMAYYTLTTRTVRHADAAARPAPGGPGGAEHGHLGAHRGRQG
jgi:hypothetical protein